MSHKPIIAVVILVAIIVLGTAAFSVRHIHSDFGDKGQSCFPNGTCNPPNTCYQIGKYRQCEKEIKPVYPKGAPVCYVLKIKSEDTQKCFETMGECLRSFARNTSKYKAIKGCWF